jgi:hypothetical protein
MKYTKRRLNDSTAHGYASPRSGRIAGANMLVVMLRTLRWCQLKYCWTFARACRSSGYLG